MTILEHPDARARLVDAFEPAHDGPIVAFQGHPWQRRRHDQPASTTPANVSMIGPDASSEGPVAAEIA